MSIILKTIIAKDSLLSITDGLTRLTDTTASTSSITGALVVSGGVGVAGNLYADGITRLTNTTESTSATTGALVVSGGVGVGGALYTGGIIRFTDTTVSTSTTTGALVVSGGVGIGGALYAGGITRFTDTTESTSSSVGALVVSGGVGIAGALFAGGITRLTDTTASTSTTSGALVVSGGVGIAGALNVGGITGFTDTTTSTSISTGALRVSGGVGIAGNLFAGGITRLTDTTASTSSITGALVVSGGVGIAGALYAGGITRLTNTTESTSATTGALVVSGGVGVGGNLTVGYQGVGVSAISIARSDGNAGGIFSIMGTGGSSSLRITNGSGGAGRVEIDAGSNGVYFSFNYFNGASTSRNFSITTTTVSTSTTSGALVVSGGIGITGNLYAGGIVRLTDTTASTSSTTGALVVSGGVGVVGDLNVNGTAVFQQGNVSDVSVRNQILFGFNETATYQHAIKSRHLSSADTDGNAIDFYVWQTSDLLTAVGTKQAMSVTSAGVGIGTPIPRMRSTVFDTNAKMAIVSTSQSQSSALYLSTPPSGVGDAYKTAIIAQGINSWGRSNLHFCLNNNGNSHAASEDATIAHSRMIIQPDGNVGIGTTSPGFRLDVAGTSRITGNTSITSTTASTSSSTGALTVSGGVGIAGALYAGGITRLTDTTASASVSSGALVVSGGVGIAGALYAGGITSSITTLGLNDPMTALALLGDTGGGVATLGARFKLSRYESSGSNARTRMDIELIHGDGTVQNVMAIRSDGNLGIGTTAPRMRSTVHGANAKMAIVSTGETQESALYFGTPQTVSISNAYKTAIIAQGINGWSRNNLHFCLNNNGNSNAASEDATIAHSRMVITPVGNVGIGTTTPGFLLDVNGTSRITGNTSITSTTASTSSSTGALTVSGGVGIAGDLYAGGIARLTNTTASTSTTTGALTVAGGVGIGGVLNMSDIILINGSGAVPTTTTRSIGTRIVLFSGITGTDVDSAIGISASSIWYSTNSLAHFHRFYHGTSNTVTISGTTLQVNQTTASTSTTTGALVVSGGVGITGALFAGGITRLTDTTTSTSTGTGALVVSGGVGIIGDLYAGGIVRLTDTTASTSSTTGALVVSGGVGIVGDLRVSSRMFIGPVGGSGTIHLGGGNPDDADYDMSVIETRSYDTDKSEMVLFKGNDVPGDDGPDRIRLRAAAIAFDTYPTNSSSRTAENIRMFINSTGNVGIGTTAPAFLLDVAGTSRITGNTSITSTTASTSTTTGALTVSGGIGANNGFIGSMSSNSTTTSIGFIATDLTPFGYGDGEVGLSGRPWSKMHAGEFNVISDARLKNDIRIYTQGLSFITQLVPKSFKYKHDKTGKTKIGFMAQEILEINPTFEGVNYEEAEDIYTMTMDQFTGPLVNCVKELNTKIISLETELIMMKNFLRSKFPDDGI